MSEVPVSSLDDRQQKLVENARAALERGNLDYALDACGQILKVVPGCLPVRRLQRAAQLRQFQKKNRLMALALNSLMAAPFFMGSARKDPAKAFEAAEKALAGNPNSVVALKTMGEAAMSLGLPETAAFAHEAVRELEPDDQANLLALGEALLAAGRPEDALFMADAVLRVSPVDGGAQNLMRKASVAQTLAKGSWELASSFRENLNDEAQTVSQEQGDKAVTSEDVTLRLIDETRALVQQEPENLSHYRTLVQACRQLGRLDEALIWTRQARRQPAGATDSAFDKQESELQTALLERRLRECEALAEKNPADPAAAARRDMARAELADFRLRDAQRTVERYPNDFAARQFLGECLLAAGQLDPAITQFQQAQKNPQVRIAALTGLGRAFKAKKLYDLALVQFGAAKDELAGMTGQKKEIIYELGLCHELMGQTERAIAEFKLVYAEDIGFRDVAEKINAFYAQK